MLRLDGSIRKIPHKGKDVYSLRVEGRHQFYCCMEHREVMVRLIEHEHGADSVLMLSLTKEYIKGQYQAIECDYHRMVVNG